MLTLHDIAAQIVATRKAKGLSQTDLSRRADVSRSQIDRLENGRTSDMGFRALSRLLLALDMGLSLGRYNQGRPTLDDLRTDDLNKAELQPAMTGERPGSEGEGA